MESFTARRSAASNLPNFQLPPPDHLQNLHRHPAYAPSSLTQPIPPVASHVMTPPVGLPSDGLSPIAQSASSSGSSAAGIPPYQPMGYWPTPAAPSYTYSSAPPSQMPASFSHNSNYMGRSMYSPALSYPNRNVNSPTAGEALPPPPYDLSHPPFQTMASSGGQQQNLPNLAPTQQHQAQQQAQHQHQQHDHNQHQQQLNNNNQQHPSSQAPSQSPLHAPESYGARPPSSTAYYTPASTPQQSSFPAYTHQSPSQQSPNTSGPPSNRISPVVPQQGTMAAPQGYHRPYSGYNLPAMAGHGPIMSNVHNPGNQMALVGGMNMQYPPHQMSAPMYGHHGHHPGQAQAQNDRPFKCDQCPQSFNRNHDLKRHKRIHLAVKPFPCGHCEKSFSRKDALKRHILVKGCGKSGAATVNVTDGTSPIDKDAMSDSAGDSSPVMVEIMKKEL